MCEGSALRLIILSIPSPGDVHQVYVRWPACHHGDHRRGEWRLFFLPGIPWDDAGFSPPNRFIAAVKFVVLLVDTDARRSITPDQFTALLLLSVCSVSQVSS